MIRLGAGDASAPSHIPREHSLANVKCKEKAKKRAKATVAYECAEEGKKHRRKSDTIIGFRQPVDDSQIECGGSVAAPLARSPTFQQTHELMTFLRPNAQIQPPSPRLDRSVCPTQRLNAVRAFA